MIPGTRLKAAEDLTMPSEFVANQESANADAAQPLAAIERENLARLVRELGIPVSDEKLDQLLSSLSQLLFVQLNNMNEKMFDALSEDLGTQIATRVAGSAGPFHVEQRGFDNWALFESGTFWSHPGARFRLSFASGLELVFFYNPEAENEKWDFNAEGKSAVVEFGYPLGTRLLTLSIGLGEPVESSLFLQAELSPVVVASKEPVVKLAYNLYRDVGVDGRGMPSE